MQLNFLSLSFTLGDVDIPVMDSVPESFKKLCTSLETEIIEAGSIRELISC